MEGECKVALGPCDDTEARPQSTWTVRPSSKLTTALLTFILCLAVAAAALLFFNGHTKGSRPDEDDFDLRHTLRQLSDVKDVRAAIHLEGEYNASLTTSVQWRNQVDQSHSQGGLILDNNEIVIPRHGLYFVYSQASFRVSCSSSDTGDLTSKPMVHVSHTVLRWSSSYGNDDSKKSYHPILHSVRTACQKTASSEEDGGWYTAVYMGAVFNLRTGDRLKTETKEDMLQKLEDDNGETFFGVFAL